MPPTPITREVRLAWKLSRQVEADEAMIERATEEKAFSNNCERLRSDRPAREAAGLPVQVTKKTKLSKKLPRVLSRSRRSRGRALPGQPSISERGRRMTPEQSRTLKPGDRAVLTAMSTTPARFKRQTQCT